VPPPQKKSLQNGCSHVHYHAAFGTGMTANKWTYTFSSWSTGRPTCRLYSLCSHAKLYGLI